MLHRLHSQGLCSRQSRTVTTSRGMNEDCGGAEGEMGKGQGGEEERLSSLPTQAHTSHTRIFCLRAVNMRSAVRQLADHTFGSACIQMITRIQLGTVGVLAVLSRIDIQVLVADQAPRI